MQNYTNAQHKAIMELISVASDLNLACIDAGDYTSKSAKLNSDVQRAILEYLLTK